MPSATDLRRWKGILVAGAAWSAALALLGLVVCFLGPVVLQGWGALDPAFVTSLPSNAGRSGGVFSIAVSTILIVAVCLAVAAPIGVGTAIYLAEFADDDSVLIRCVQRSIDVLAGVPSVVFGLFGNALFCKFFGLGFSIVSGGLTLACMVLPLIIRTTEQGLRMAPQDLRMSAAALGLAKPDVVIHIVLPCAVPSFAAGFVLAVGRAVSETAALIFTSGYVDRMPTSLWDSGRSLSLHIYDLAMNVPGGDQNAYRSAFLLVVCLLTVNGVARLMTRALGQGGANHGR